MKSNYFEGNLIKLRALEPEDLDFLYRIENDPELWDVSCFTVPYSKYVLKQYIADTRYDMFSDCQLRLMIQLKGEDKPVGTIDITDFSIQHSRGAIGIAILKEYRQKNIGNEALSLLCDYAFRFLHIHQLYAHVAKNNSASLSLFRSCQFATCGTVKDWLHIENSWTDVVVMQRIADTDAKH
jgi:diamine N-acetyltransferase